MISAVEKFMKSATTTYMIERNSKRNSLEQAWRWPVEQERIQIDVANQMVERWESNRYSGASSNAICLADLERYRRSIGGAEIRQAMFFEVMATLTEVEVTLKEEDRMEKQLQRQLQNQFGIRKKEQTRA
jgi:phosphatidate phosphatase APP1